MHIFLYVLGWLAFLAGIVCGVAAFVMAGDRSGLNMARMLSMAQTLSLSGGLLFFAVLALGLGSIIELLKRIVGGPKGVTSSSTTTPTNWPE